MWRDGREMTSGMLLSSQRVAYVRHWGEKWDFPMLALPPMATSWWSPTRLNSLQLAPALPPPPTSDSAPAIMYEHVAQRYGKGNSVLGYSSRWTDGGGHLVPT